jgi:hypothetical protein
MFDAEKLTKDFERELAQKPVLLKVEPTTIDDQPSGPGQPAALVTLEAGDGKTAKRVFTEADQASSKLAATIKAFCERVL